LSETLAAHAAVKPMLIRLDGASAPNKRPGRIRGATAPAPSCLADLIKLRRLHPLIYLKLQVSFTIGKYWRPDRSDEAPKTSSTTRLIDDAMAGSFTADAKIFEEFF
jgi:hypothetical protein